MRCWSCGSDIPGGGQHIFTCPTCSMVEELKGIRGRLESSGAESLYQVVEVFGPDLSEVAGILEAGFEELSGQLANIASILEWGFEEINWRLDQISETLDSIDRTLKSPAATRAREWRRIAEELRRRKVLDKSKEFFLKSLDASPLDYRTYIGLGKTYLELGVPQKARFYWEESLPHAPKGKIDYKSYSYRLIGRLDFCENNPRQAARALKKAIELSPNYYLGHYNYTQYCALVGDEENCLNSLEIAVVGDPSLYKLAEKERNFKLLRNKVQKLLEGIDKEASLMMYKILSELEAALRGKYGSTTDWNRLAKSALDYGKEKIILKDYSAFPEARSIAEDALDCLKSYEKLFDTICSGTSSSREKDRLWDEAQKAKEKLARRLGEVLWTREEEGGKNTTRFR